jgi:hypothetical protein
MVGKLTSTMSEARKNKVRAELQDAHTSVLRAIESGETNELRSMQQLELIERELRKMIRALDSGELPPRGERAPGLWHIITDSWSPTDQLGEKVIAAELAYERLQWPVQGI